jgi:DNA modification methylase
MIAGHLDSPEVANAKSISQAAGIVGRKMEAELALELTKRGKQRTVKHTLIHGDFADAVIYDELPRNFSCIIADPPYGIGADKFGDAAQLTHTYKDTEEHALVLAKDILTLGLLLTLSEAHLYMFCDIEHFTFFRDMGNAMGWTVWRTPLIWKKTSSSAHAPQLNRGFRRSHELILFASKGGKPFSQVYSDVIDAASLRDKDVAAQKPSELYETLLSRSCLPGDKVLDPCCGSGTIFKAAENCGLEAWGVEKDEGAYGIANLTLSSLGER